MCTAERGSNLEIEQHKWPLYRIGFFVDFAEIVGVLVDERSRRVTGKNILVNGGCTA